MSDPSRPTENPVISELDQLPDRDREETAEWRASLDAVVRNAGPERAVYLMRRVHEFAASTGMSLPGLLHSDYINTVPAAAQPEFDGDLEMESRITALNRWNAAAMVTRGARLGLGGHISTYASAAWLYEIGFHHFFRGKDADGSGDQLFVQGHASPGIYARVFLEGRLSESQLDSFRREAGGHGLPSYPHPGGCRGCGSSRRSPWDWAPSAPSTRPASTAICTPAASRTPPPHGCGRSWATGRWTSRSRRPP